MPAPCAAQPADATQPDTAKQLMMAAAAARWDALAATAPRPPGRRWAAGLAPVSQSAGAAVRPASAGAQPQAAAAASVAQPAAAAPQPAVAAPQPPATAAQTAAASVAAQP